MTNKRYASAHENYVTLNPFARAQGMLREASRRITLRNLRDGFAALILSPFAALRINAANELTTTKDGNAQHVIPVIEEATV